MQIRSLKDGTNLTGKRILLRVDLNVPVQNGKIRDDFRIKQTLPTINFLIKNKAKIILLSHFEEKSGKPGSLKPIFEFLKKYIPRIAFASDFSELETSISKTKEGDTVLFENLRFNPGEKTNDPEFAKKLSSFGDIFVNEAFSVSHRNHASIVGISKYLPSFAGFLFQNEVENLSEAFNPAHPSLFILGGSKFETKIPLIKKVLKHFDKVFVGGALAHNFFKEKGLEIGKSLVSEGNFDLKEILESKRIILPIDVVVKNKKGQKEIKKSENVLADEIIEDAGPETILNLKKVIKNSKIVVWNGPIGNYEEGYIEGTSELAKIIAESKVEAVVGGGDTLAAISTLNLQDKFKFISTGGGAMLEFLLKETLPGIEVLMRD
ncbi:MAG: phosphoglycerate kinase [Patescibacteria group bacterium]